MISNPSSDNVTIPDEMYRKGRPIDPNFDHEEKLYVRFSAVSGGIPDPDSFRGIDQSGNRSKYSQPQWILITGNPIHSNWGYGAIKIRDIPKSINEGLKIFIYQTEHDPGDKNYSHCEVRAYLDGNRVTDNKRKRAYFKVITTKFRLYFSRRIDIIEEPKI